MVPSNHSIFEKGPMEPPDFWDVVLRNHINFKFATIGTTRFEFTAPALLCDETLNCDFHMLRGLTAMKVEILYRLIYNQGVLFFFPCF